MSWHALRIFGNSFEEKHSNLTNEYQPARSMNAFRRNEYLIYSLIYSRIKRFISTLYGHTKHIPGPPFRTASHHVANTSASAPISTRHRSPVSPRISFSKELLIFRLAARASTTPPIPCLYTYSTLRPLLMFCTRGARSAWTLLRMLAGVV